VFPATLRQGRVFRDLVAGWIPLVSCALVRRSAIVDAGGLDESLQASEDRDLWLRLAERTDFIGTADVLVVRHEHRGAQLSRNYALLLSDAEVLDDKWRAAIAASCGSIAYSRWRARLVTLAEMAGMMHALDAGDRFASLRHVGRMARHLPWSAPGVARGLAMAVLGRRTYGRLAVLQSAIRERLGPVDRTRRNVRAPRRPA
jgi:hypothetical protein